MQPEQLFLQTTAELEAKLASRDEYDILAISRLLRLLLLDAEPLANRVNRAHRLKLRFRCTQSYLLNLPEGLQPTSMSSQDGFDPETSIPGNRPLDVTLDGLLSEIVAIHEKKELSVADVIKYEAHVGGGVHAGRPADDAAEALHSLNANWSIGGYTPTLRQLQAIGRVVLRGLGELRERVRPSDSASR
jgi:hypothetical protein